MEPNCVSYNILVSNDSPSITKCEMNNATHFEHPSDLVSFPNSTYRGSKGVFIAAMIRIIEVFSWPIPMSLLQFNFLLVYSHIFYSDCKKPYLLTAVKEMNLKAIFALMNATKTVVKIRPEKFRLVRDSNPWPLRCRCSALSTELTSHVGAGLQFIDMIFINLQSFILPFTGLFGTNIMTSTQLAYTTVRLSAFNYRYLQLTRLVQKRSLQNNAYLTEVSTFTERQRFVYKHDSIATLIEFDCPLNMESLVLVNAVWAPDEKNKSLELL